MISFRRHVVALVAVLLALAVGVALGGGPLSEVGSSLTSATSEPTTEPADPADDTAFGESFAAQSAARLYAGGLSGHPVSVVTLPGADEEVVRGLAAQIETAGGSVAGTYALEHALVDPGEKSLVDTLGSQLVTQLGPGFADGDLATYERMGQLLGSAVATTLPGGARAEEKAGAIRQSLTGARLATVPAGEATRAPLVLVVLGDDNDDDVLAGLMAGLAAKAAGVVVVGDAASGIEGDVAGLRASQLARKVATVDGTETTLGRVAATLVLVRSLTTPGGSFGASGSDGAVPLG